MSREQIISAIVFCLYIVAVAFLCFAKPDTIPQMPQLWFGLPADKVGHFLMFVPFPVLAYMIFYSKEMSRAAILSTLAVILVVGVGLAMGTEHIQAQLGYREADLKDLYADAAGLAAGGIFTMVYTRFRKKR